MSKCLYQLHKIGKEKNLPLKLSSQPFFPNLLGCFENSPLCRAMFAAVNAEEGHMGHRAPTSMCSPERRILRSNDPELGKNRWRT